MGKSCMKAKSIGKIYPWRKWKTNGFSTLTIDHIFFDYEMENMSSKEGKKY
jgi:hypothetical protein